MQDEPQKPFDAVAIIFMVGMAFMADAAAFVGDFSLAIPGIGIVVAGLSKIVGTIVWGVIGFWFIIKVGFGLPFLIELMGGPLELLGVPVYTPAVVIGIMMANSKFGKAFGKVGKVAVLAAATVATGGAAAPAAAGAIAGEAGVATAGAAAAEGMGAAGAAATRGGVSAAGRASLQGGARAGQVSEESFGMPKEPLEKVMDIMKDYPQTNIEDEEDEGKGDNEYRLAA